MILPFAAATDHLGLFSIVIGIGFLVGVYGHMCRSKTLVITGIVVIAVVCIYFIAAGEIQTFPS